MADVLTKQQVELCRRGERQQLWGSSAGQLCDSHEELRRKYDEAVKLLKAIRAHAIAALEPVDDSATFIARMRGHTEEEDQQDALRVIRDWIDAALKPEANGG